jgi:hypothetical protein
MRSLLGCVIVPMLLLAGPLAAQDGLEGATPTAPHATASLSEEAARSAAAVSSNATSAAEAVAADLSLPPPPPPVTLILKVDLGAQRLSVVDRGDIRHVWPISSGQRGYATATGVFRPQWMTKRWFSRQWDMAPMPHAIFFNRGAAFHGTSAVSSLGRPASHGCIRLAPGNAARLYALVQKHGLAGTKVIVHGTPAQPAIAQRPPKSHRTQFAGAGQGSYRASAYTDPPVRRNTRVSRYGPPSGFNWPFQ